MNKSQLHCDLTRWRLELEKVAGGDLPRKGARAAIVGTGLHSYALYCPDLNTSHLSSWSINRETSGLCGPAHVGMYLEA